MAHPITQYQVECPACGYAVIGAGTCPCLYTRLDESGIVSTRTHGSDPPFYRPEPNLPVHPAAAPVATHVAAHAKPGQEQEQGQEQAEGE